MSQESIAGFMGLIKMIGDQNGTYRFRYSLRSLLLTFALLSIATSYHLSKVQRQRLVVTAVQEAGGYVGFADDTLYSEHLQRLEEEALSKGAPLTSYPEHRLPGPYWLRKQLGDDCFRTIDSISVNGPAPQNLFRVVSQMSSIRSLSIINDEQVDDESLQSLSAALDRLEILNLSSTSISDDGLRQIGKLRLLRGLYLRYTPITDAGVKHLISLKKLRDLDLTGTRISNDALRTLSTMDGIEALSIRKTQVTDEGLSYLSKMQQLRQVYLYDEKYLTAERIRVTARGIRALRASLPNCSVNHRAYGERLHLEGSASGSGPTAPP